MHRAMALAWVGAALTLIPSCAAMPPKSELFQRVGASEVSPSALRVEVRSLAPRFSGLLESMADEIAIRSPDLETRAAMTRFKINALPSMQAALFQPDPVAALIDAWALLAQVENAIANHPAAEDPDLERLARSRVSAMEAEIQALWRRMTGGDGENAGRRIREWAVEHPLTDGLAARHSTAPLLASVTTRAGIRPLGAAAVLLEDTRDISARMDLLTAYLPKQARWQVESLTYQLALDPTLHEQIHAQATRLLAAVERERAAIERFVTEERAAIEALIDRQRALTVQEAERAGGELIDHGVERASTLIAQGTAGAMAFAATCAGLLVLVRLAWRRIG